MLASSPVSTDYSAPPSHTPQVCSSGHTLYPMTPALPPARTLQHHTPWDHLHHPAVVIVVGGGVADYHLPCKHPCPPPPLHRGTLGAAGSSGPAWSASAPAGTLPGSSRARPPPSAHSGRNQQNQMRPSPSHSPSNVAQKNPFLDEINQRL